MEIMKYIVADRMAQTINIAFLLRKISLQKRLGMAHAIAVKREH